MQLNIRTNVRWWEKKSIKILKEYSLYIQYKYSCVESQQSVSRGITCYWYFRSWKLFTYIYLDNVVIEATLLGDCQYHTQVIIVKWSLHYTNIYMYMCVCVCVCSITDNKHSLFIKEVNYYIYIYIYIHVCGLLYQ